MRKILTLVLLLSFACSEETEFQCESCINMTISDALPIQFWKNDCPTYNEKESCGVHSFCWNDKRHCDDPIMLPWTDESTNKRYLIALDKDGEITRLFEFDQTDLGTSPDRTLYNLEFTPSELSPEICNESLQFKIVESELVNFSNPSFEGGTILPWESIFNFGNGWQWYFGDAARSNAGGSSSETNWLAQNGYFPAGSYTVRYKASNYSTGGISPLQSGLVLASGDAGVVVENFMSYTGDGILLVGDFEVEKVFSFVLTQPRTTLFFRWQKSGPGSGYVADIEINDFNIISSPFNDEDYTVLAKSDFIEFSDNLSCTVLAKYRNQRNFAGIDYANLTEDAYFYKRIPAVFFHERFPGEDEQAELSDSKIIALNGVLRAQKLLDTDYMPYHEHKKNQLILKHQFVEIDGDRWTKQDAYEIAEGNKRYPLKKATCWLTNRDFVARNVI